MARKRKPGAGSGSRKSGGRMAPVIVVAALIGALVGLGLARFPVPSYVQGIAQPPPAAQTATPRSQNRASEPARHRRRVATTAHTPATPRQPVSEPTKQPVATADTHESPPPATVSQPNASSADRSTSAFDKADSTPTPSAPAPQEKPTADAPRVKKTYKRPSALPGEIAYVRGAGSKIALTFDAGASGDPAESVLATLRSQGIHVTFFLTGKWAERYPSLVRRISDDGHEIANHTYSHPDLRKLSADSVEEQLNKTDQIIRKLTGEHTAPFFRPPFGSRNSQVLAIASKAGYRGVYWSLDSWDSVKKDVTSREIADRVLERAQAGDIVLLHCGSAATAEALPDIIRALKAQRLQIVTVSELIRL